MALPKKLKYLNLFNDGFNYMGIVSSLTLPKLTRKLEKYRGGGMNGAAPIDMGLDDDALSVSGRWAALMNWCSSNGGSRCRTAALCRFLPA
jgi:P2 family phage contractile tail tube protein